MGWENFFGDMDFTPGPPYNQGTPPPTPQQTFEAANFRNDAWIDQAKPWERDRLHRWYNPLTGETFVENITSNPAHPTMYGGGQPSQHDQMVDLNRMWSQLGGIFGNNQGGGFDMTQWGGNPNTPAWNQPMIATPGGYQPENFNQSIVDVSDIIDAERRMSDTRREDAWADAAARFGMSGMVASTPYMNQLGDVAAEEQARQDQIFGTLQYQAGTDLANRQLQESLQRRDLEEAAWSQRGNWDMAAQGQNVANNLAAWQQQGNWGQQNADRDFGAFDLENQYGFQNYQDQQGNQQAMMQMLMGMFGGGG